MAKRIAKPSATAITSTVNQLTKIARVPTDVFRTSSFSIDAHLDRDGFPAPHRLIGDTRSKPSTRWVKILLRVYRSLMGPRPTIFFGLWYLPVSHFEPPGYGGSSFCGLKAAGYEANCADDHTVTLAAANGVCGLRRKLSRFSAAVATSREGHRSAGIFVLMGQGSL
jgi:hypothetical protein